MTSHAQLFLPQQTLKFFQVPFTQHIQLKSKSLALHHLLPHHTSVMLMHTCRYCSSMSSEHTMYLRTHLRIITVILPVQVFSFIFTRYSVIFLARLLHGSSLVVRRHSRWPSFPYSLYWLELAFSCQYLEMIMRHTTAVDSTRVLTTWGFFDVHLHLSIWAFLHHTRSKYDHSCCRP